MAQRDEATPLVDRLQLMGHGHLPGLLGIEVTSARRGEVRLRLPLATEHLAANGYLHAGTVVSLADTACGYGSMASLPDGATGFTTAELKSNFIGTATEGALSARAWLVHGGRTTQVWDTEVIHEETGKTVALFRCTQVMLYPKPASRPPTARPNRRS